MTPGTSVTGTEQRASARLFTGVESRDRLTKGMCFELNHLIENILAGVEKIAAIALVADPAAIGFDQSNGALEIALCFLRASGACVAGGPRLEYFNQRQRLFFALFGDALRLSVMRLGLFKVVPLCGDVAGAQPHQKFRVRPLTFGNPFKRRSCLLHLGVARIKFMALCEFDGDERSGLRNPYPVLFGLGVVQRLTGVIKRQVVTVGQAIEVRCQQSIVGEIVQARHVGQRKA